MNEQNADDMDIEDVDTENAENDGITGIIDGIAADNDGIAAENDGIAAENDDTATKILPGFEFLISHVSKDPRVDRSLAIIIKTMQPHYEYAKFALDSSKNNKSIMKNKSDKEPEEQKFGMFLV